MATETLSVLGALATTRDALGEICDTWELLTDVLESYMQELAQYEAAIADQQHVEAALAKLPPKNRSALFMALAGMAELVPPVPPEKMDDFIDKTKQSMATLRRIRANLDAALDGVTR